MTRSGMQNASSISGLMLTTEAMICEIPEGSLLLPAAVASTARAAWTTKSFAVLGWKVKARLRKEAGFLDFRGQSDSGGA